MVKEEIEELGVAHWFCDGYLRRLLRPHHQEPLGPFKCHTTRLDSIYSTCDDLTNE